MPRFSIAALAVAIAVVVLTAGADGRVHAYVPQPGGVGPDASGRIQYFIADGKAGSAYRPGDAELAMWALEEWERGTGGALRFTQAGRSHDAAIRFEWLPWAEDASLGRMERSSADGRPIATLLIRPDETNFRPSIRRRVRADPLMRDVVLFYVCLHEIGHALGLGHSSDLRDIMWSGGSGVTLPVYDRYRKRLRSREDIQKKPWLSRGDIERFRALWSRSPIR